MVTRALVKAEIDNLRDDDVEIVYSLIKRILRQSDLNRAAHIGSTPLFCYQKPRSIFVGLPTFSSS